LAYDTPSYRLID